MAPSSKIDGRTPYELWYNQIPSMQYIKVLNAVDMSTSRSNTEPNSTLEPVCACISVCKKGYRLIDINTHVILYSRDVVFKEDEFPPLTGLASTPEPTQPTSRQQPTAPPASVPPPPPPATGPAPEPEAEPVSPPVTTWLATSGPVMRTAPDIVNKRVQPSLREAIDRTAIHYSFRTVTDSDPPHTSAPKRSRLTAEATHTRLNSEEACDITFNSGEDTHEQEQRKHLLYTLLAIRPLRIGRQWTPFSVSGRKWYREPRSQDFHGFRFATVTPPKGRKILNNRWVFVVKYTDTGEIDRFKARLVIKGFLQEIGIDYNEILWRLLLTIAALLDLEVHQMDVKTAFLNGYLEEEIYMAQPEGFKIPVKEHLVCKFLTSLYGLKQAPRVWYQTLSAFLESLGFLKLIKDRCVFRRTVDNLTCYIAVYVDDLLIIAPTPALVSELKSALKKTILHFATKVIDRVSDYIPIATPAERNAKLSVSIQPSSEQEKDAMKSTPYGQAVGSVMYLMVGTRPDMGFYMREVSQFLANPGMEHWKAVIRGLKYLSGTKEHGLLLGGSSDITKENLADQTDCVQ
ncbi:LOW QUALITY PROTEIN: Transposable element [Phytophthora megakarya]|uniref:Transposable element n=1 Tax=Phytophthora megakarya TaxID=4795 RepID=A0A225V4V9_9STRA|nr:LOW QUALITY PROTEIN: Transposable element [Phytophthora megakarya]